MMWILSLAESSTAERCNRPQTAVQSNYTEKKNDMTDDDIRALWRSKGGSFHGPKIETGCMPESSLLVFLRELLVLPTNTIKIQPEKIEFGGGLDTYPKKTIRQAERLAMAQNVKFPDGAYKVGDFVRLRRPSESAGSFIDPRAPLEVVAVNYFEFFQLPTYTLSEINRQGGVTPFRDADLKRARKPKVAIPA